MVLEDISDPAGHVALTAAFVASLVVLALVTALYPFIWYIWYLLYIALSGFIFSRPDTSLTLKVFYILFSIRYLRVVVNIGGFFCYKATPIPDSPSLKARHVAVIVPTVEPHGQHFENCIQSILANNPGKIIIVTAGPGNYKRAIQCVTSMNVLSKTQIKDCNDQDKRRQIHAGLKEINTDDTPITVFCDDHVSWPPNFLPHVLAPFEDEEVGCVGTRKRVLRISKPCFSSSKPYVSLPKISANYWNIAGCLYLERHNFEIAATNAIDGGVFVVSGRTSAHRSEILKDPAFMREFINEKVSICCLGNIGPLNADDDNFVTRWTINHGWKIKIQYSDDACITTNLGEYPKFLAQCMRWARTTWRSNPRSLRSLQTWRTQPWCIYSVYLTSLLNFAILWDPALIILLCLAPDPSIDKKLGVPSLCVWIFGTKFLKTGPHFWRHPLDLAYFIPIILFGYYHSIIKFRALLTVWDIGWGSRPLDDGNIGGVGPNGDEEQGLLGVVNGVNDGYGTLSNEDNVGDVTPNEDVKAGDLTLIK